MKHKTTIPLYIRAIYVKKLNINFNLKYINNDFVEIPIGTELELTQKYSNSFSAQTEDFSFYNKSIITDPNDEGSYYAEKIEESWVPKPGELVWIKVFSNWSAGYYKRFESQTDKHVVKEIASGGNIFSSKDILPFIANPDKLSIDVLNKISAENDKGINKVEVSNSFSGKSEESYRNQLLDINQWCEFILNNRSTIRERVLWSMINDIHNRTTD